MKKIRVLAILLLTIIGVIACKEEKKDTKTNTSTKTEASVATTAPKTKITLEKLTGSPSYADAVLAMKAPANTTITEVGEVDFNFTVNNYELGQQTAGSNATLLANSSKGQHIHFILNNQPYSAHYTPTFKKEIPAGVHHLVAFLSRSYHESVKNENSVVVKKLIVGENPQDTNGLKMEAPTLIYSRPKGTYKGKDTENLLLDFFVLNTKLSETGHKVKATINGEAFTITEWVPHVIKGLPMGEVTIQLELIDENGTIIPGPFNSVTRTVTLTE
ncbi:hypothetical protein EZY14_019900 [Kordia sp. TARA_039_SRF]|nr:hypothetical protein EZY14_019900 [Kordia sp. TARA_039_SRF]